MPAADVGSNVPLAGIAVPLTRFRSEAVAYTHHSGIRTPETFVIRDAAAWAALWQRIHALATPGPPLPDVDFGQEMVVAAALGTRNSGGYDILLAQAADDAGSLVIQVVETSPGADCMTTQAFTRPVDLARVARRDGPVSFLATQRVRSCGP